MRNFFFILALGYGLVTQAHGFTVYNLNVFDQLQGDWDQEFRATRMEKISDWIQTGRPDLVVFQEAQGRPGKNKDSADISSVSYKYRRYVHEMQGKDGESYGYFMTSKKKPEKAWQEGFFFPGGVERKTQAAVWKHVLGSGEKSSCLGVLSLHLSYQNSEVRQKEARWVLNWVKLHTADCKSWLVLGDFNADSSEKEIQILLQGGLKSLFKEKKPTVGAFNPIRQIYGKNVPSQTIDWAFGWNLPVQAEARIVLDKAVDGVWVSDHAGIEVVVP